MRKPSCTKIAYVSPHCVLDFTNGAATATRDGLRVLIEQRFDCQAYCGTRLDEPHEGMLQESLFQRGVKYEVRKARLGPYDARLLFAVDDNLPVTVFLNASTRGGWMNVEEAQAFLTGCDIFLRQNRPDIIWTYGGDPVSIAVQHLAKRLNIRVVFTLYNFSYFDRRPFEAVDCVAVPCEFSRQFYKEKLGLDCRVLPVIVNWQAASINRTEDGTRSVPATIRPPITDHPPRYVTLINPHFTKGVYVFARIARELARRRPDIPILVTQGRSHPDALKAPELGLAAHLAGFYPAEPLRDGRNITLLPFNPDPKTFYPTVYSVTKMLLMPSLWNESFGLVAAEAMLNGIPVLASNRGALPETVASAGFLFDIPARYTPESREVATAEEVEPWVETIIRLWDDDAEYERRSQAARDHAQQWRPERLAPIYCDFFQPLRKSARAADYSKVNGRVAMGRVFKPSPIVHW